MNISGEAKILRIILGEDDKLFHKPVYEIIVTEARKAHLAGCSVFRGIMGFGRNSVIHSSKFLAVSEDLPILIEIVDESTKIDNFIPNIKEIFESADCGGLITSENIEIIHYSSAEKGIN